MNDNWRLTAKSITKYNPSSRDKDGNYNPKEWSSFSQIGEVFDSEEFSLKSYLVTETQYIEAAILFFEFHNCHQIIFKSVEKIGFDDYELEDKEILVGCFNLFKEDNIISIEELSNYIKLVLRELAWGEFYCKESNNICLRFGHDFYMYANSNVDLKDFISKVEALGLFVR